MSIEKLPISEDLVPAEKQLSIKKRSQILGLLLVAGMIVLPVASNKLERLCPDTIVSRMCLRKIFR
jgi:hypothetical protein